MRTASYRDIVGQADSLAATMRLLEHGLPALDGHRPWLFTGSGASYHAATTAAAMLSTVSDVSAAAAPAAEVWMNPAMWVKPDAVVVALSRTGTTTETVQALDVAARRGAATVGFSLVAGTDIVANADHGFALEHVAEEGRVMTRSFSNLLLASELLAFRANSRTAEPYLAAVRSLPDAVETAMATYDALAQTVAKDGPDHVVFLGSGPDIGLCRQAALQLQETSRLSVEAHSVLDYRHGPIAALNPTTTVVILTTGRSLPADRIVAHDVSLLGGTPVVVGAQQHLNQFASPVEQIPVPGNQPHWLSGNAALPFLQLLAYHLTVQLDADPESVTNLDRTKEPHVDPHVLPTTLFDPSSSPGQ